MEEQDLPIRGRSFRRQLAINVTGLVVVWLPTAIIYHFEIGKEESSRWGGIVLCAYGVPLALPFIIAYELLKHRHEKRGGGGGQG